MNGISYQTGFRDEQMSLPGGNNKLTCSLACPAPRRHRAAVADVVTVCIDNKVGAHQHIDIRVLAKCNRYFCQHPRHILLIAVEISAHHTYRHLAHSRTQRYTLRVLRIPVSIAEAIPPYHPSMHHPTQNDTPQRLLSPGQPPSRRSASASSVNSGQG